MAYTDLREVWRADVDGTDERIQAEGVWLPTFGTDIVLPPEAIILTPGYVAFSAAAAVPNTREPNPDETVVYREAPQQGTVPAFVPGPAQQAQDLVGEGIRPDESPGAWADLRGAWLTVTENNQVLDRGSWAPTNIGVATPLPVNWFGLAGIEDGTTSTLTTDEGTIRQHTTILGRVESGILQVANQTFSAERGTGHNVAHLYASLHRDAATNVNHRGLIFLHIDIEAVLTIGVLGETYLQGPVVSPFDMFRGVANQFTLSVPITNDEGRRVVETYGFRLDAELPSRMWGPTATGSIWPVLPVHGEINQERELDRIAYGLYWSGDLTQIDTDEEGDPVYEDYVAVLQDSSTNLVEVSLAWTEMGGVGRNVLP